MQKLQYRKLSFVSLLFAIYMDNLCYSCAVCKPRFAESLWFFGATCTNFRRKTSGRF